MECTYCYHGLPDILMYGGDTTPWFITLEDENGNALIPTEGDVYQCVLSIIPFGTTFGLGDSAFVFSPVLQKTSTFENNGENIYQAKINFVPADTLSLRGKYIYQIEVKNTGSNRVNQGKMTVLANINRKV